MSYMLNGSQATGDRMSRLAGKKPFVGVLYQSIRNPDETIEVVKVSGSVVEFNSSLVVGLRKANLETFYDNFKRVAGQPKRAARVKSSRPPCQYWNE